MARRTSPLGKREGRAVTTRPRCRWSRSRGTDLEDGYAGAGRLVGEVGGDAGVGREEDETLGQEVHHLGVPPERRGLAVAVPVGTADHLVNAAGLGPPCRELLHAGSAAVHEDHVRVFPARRVELEKNRVGVAVLPARDGDQGSVGEILLRLRILAGADEVPRVDGGRGHHPGPAGVRSAPGPPHLSRLGEVLGRSRVPHFLEGVAPPAQVPRPVRQEFQLPRLDLRSVLFLLQVAEFGRDAVDVPFKPPDLGVEGVHEAPEERARLVGQLEPGHSDPVGEDGEGFGDRTDGGVPLPGFPGVELVALGGGPVELRHVADVCGDGLISGVDGIETVDGFAVFDVKHFRFSE